MLRYQQPKVTVVIPNYNRANDLQRCLSSLVEQTFCEFEVMVCDDGSTDNSAEVAAGFSDRLDIVFETADNFGGPARPRNSGISRARAPYVAFLDSDDWWAPEKLAKSIRVLEAGADVVYHDLYIVRSQSQREFKEKLNSSPPMMPMFQALLCSGMSIPNSSVVVRKCLLDQIGGISEKRELISVEDYDTWIRLAHITERFVRVDGCYGYYWVGGGNISAASPKQQARIKSLYEGHLDALSAGAKCRAEGFLAYRVGRIAHQHNDFKTALSYYWTALSHPIESRYRLKAAYFAAQAFYSNLKNLCA